MDRTRLRRVPGRASDDRDALLVLLDESLVAHVGLVRDGEPVVLPMAYGRVGEVLYLHVSTGSGTAIGVRDGARVCATVTAVDGLVLARSGFHHSMNYRCAVVHAVARLVTDPDERERALRAVVEHLEPGRWDALRPMTAREAAATAVFALPLDEVSLKVRAGGVADEPEDLGWPVWAGVVPVRTTRGTPIPDAALT